MPTLIWSKRRADRRRALFFSDERLGPSAIRAGAAGLQRVRTRSICLRPPVLRIWRLVPQTKWLIASAMQGEGGLYRSTRRRRGEGQKSSPPGAPSVSIARVRRVPGASLRDSGGDARALPQTGPRLGHTLYAVHHGDRESIEVFEVNAKSTPPAVSWIGCAVVPDPVGINSVAALPDGGFVLTNFDPRQPPPPGGGRGGGLSSKLAAGEQNGEVWEWHAKSGWAKVPGSETAGANGIEVSRDGKWLYIAQWGKQSFLRLSRGKTPVERQEIPLGLPHGQHSLGARRQDAARGGTRQRGRPGLARSAAAARRRKPRSSSASIRRR